jgi:(p)ppGpp synthase/HD superfamily hydrolase
MQKSLGIEFERAIRLLTKYFPINEEGSRKPVLFHDVRVAVYLYENGYSDDIVLAGILHDAIEWSKITEEMLQDEFSDKITNLVLASTKNKDIERKNRNEELIARCAKAGEEALIIKTADIIDSFKWYLRQNNQEQLQSHCIVDAKLILKYKPEKFQDKIFGELITWIEKTE